MGPDGKAIRKKEKRELEIGRCGTELFQYPVKQDIIDYNIANLMCIKNKNYSLEGDFYSRRFRYLQIKMLKCNPKTSSVPCKSQAEISKFLNPLRFSFPFVNQYLDFSDFD